MDVSDLISNLELISLMLTNRSFVVTCFRFSLKCFYEVNKVKLILIVVSFLYFLGDVFVVYCKDYGSTYLPSYKLYNPRLLSISMHEILRKLSKKDRVFTVYAAFHQQQVKVLERCFDHETELFWIYTIRCLFCVAHFPIFFKI